MARWTSVIHHPLFGIGITLGAYQLVLAGFEKTRWIFLQPVLVSMLLVIGVLLTCGLSYAEYRKSAEIMGILLGPADGGAGGAALSESAAHSPIVLADFYYAGDRRCIGYRPVCAARLVVRRRAHDADDHGAQVGDLADRHAGGRADRRRGGAGGGVRADHRGGRGDASARRCCAAWVCTARGARHGVGHDRPRGRHLGRPCRRAKSVAPLPRWP